MPEAQYDFTEQNNRILADFDEMIQSLDNAIRFAETNDGSPQYVRGLQDVKERVKSARSLADELPAADVVTEVAEEAAEVAEEAAEAIEENAEEVAEAVAEEIPETEGVTEEAAEEIAEEIIEQVAEVAEVAEAAAEEAAEAESHDDGAAEAEAAETAEAAADVASAVAVETLPPEDVPPKVSHWFYKKFGKRAG